MFAAGGVAIERAKPLAVLTLPVVLLGERTHRWRCCAAGGVAIERIETKCSVVDAAGEAHEGPITPSRVTVPRSIRAGTCCTGRTGSSGRTCQTCRASRANGSRRSGCTVSSIRAGCTSRASRAQ